MVQKSQKLEVDDRKVQLTPEYRIFKYQKNLPPGQNGFWFLISSTGLDHFIFKRKMFLYIKHSN
jgi:hypothetical protein